MRCRQILLSADFSIGEKHAVLESKSRFFLFSFVKLCASGVIFFIKIFKKFLNKSGQRGQNISREVNFMIMDKIALILTIIGALNWGSIGLFRFDIVAWIFGGQDAMLSRIVYTLVALAGIWCISLLFRERDSRPAGDYT